MFAGFVSKLLPPTVVATVVGLVFWTTRSPLTTSRAREAGVNPASLAQVVSQVDSDFAARWQRDNITPAGMAPELQVLRRLSLALMGTVPSLEEIRQFELDQRTDRITHWTRRFLADSRFHNYFAERLARGYVGTEDGPFLVYRRERFVDWLADQLRQNVPYDVVVRKLIGQQGLWTGQPATNFVTVAITNGDVDEAKLAGKTVRAFLGQRIDCAQCHDHPFDHWKQHEFEELAAHFGQAKLTLFGLEDDRRKVYQVEDRQTLEKRLVTPAVPFHPEWLPDQGTPRQQLAAWITHPDNRRFERATANRIWGLLFGKAYVEPVDDLRDPPPPDKPDLLDILGRDFREHDYDLRRLILTIAGSRPFRLDSSFSIAEDAAADPNTAGESWERAEAAWAVFPLVRLRPEQVIGAMLQSASIQTANQDSHLLLRTIRFFRSKDFVREYGDAGMDELLQQTGTIPQRLLLMNGKLADEVIEPNPITATGRIAGLAPTDEVCVEVAYLVCLTRRPTTAESEHFVSQLRGQRDTARERTVKDLVWSLMNSTEFSWNH